MKTFKKFLLAMFIYGVSFIETAQACSISYNGPRPEQTFVAKLGSLFIKTGVGGADCSSYTTISPFLLTVVIAVISGFISIRIIRKIKTGVVSVYLKILGYMFAILLVIICGFSIFISIITLLQTFLG